MPKVSKERLAKIVEWRKANPDRVKQHQKKANKKYYAKNYEREKARRNAPKTKKRTLEWKRKFLSVPSNRARYLLDAIKSRSEKRSMDFDESLYKIFLNPPTHCECCRCELAYHKLDNSKDSRSPSFDRIDSKGGYTIRNVRMICLRCNRLKSDSTAEELTLVAAYIERELHATPTKGAP